MLFGRLDQLGREARFGQHDPDRAHGRCARAQMEGELNVVLRQPGLDELVADLVVDLGIVDGA